MEIIIKCRLAPYKFFIAILLELVSSAPVDPSYAFCVPSIDRTHNAWCNKSLYASEFGIMPPFCHDPI